MVVLTLRGCAALLFYFAMSASMILFNASLLRNFRHPVWLTFWHQLVSSLLIFILRLINPSLVSTGDEENGIPALTLVGALRIGVPVAATHCINLVAGNTALIYNSVGFCQMIKACTAMFVYGLGCLAGIQKWSLAAAKTLATITVGLMITSVGERKFNLYGFVLQVTALVCDAARIVLLDVLLKRKLNPLSSVMVFAPISSSILLVVAMVTDRDAVSFEVLHNIGEVALIANALIAFLLNIAIFLAIQSASGLILALSGVIKDICIISGSVILMDSPISGLQVLGYAIALVGLQAYGQVSQAPEKFESGVINGFCRQFKGSNESPDPVPAQNVGACVSDREENEMPKEDAVELNGKAFDSAEDQPLCEDLR